MTIRPNPNFQKEFKVGDFVRTQVGNCQGQVRSIHGRILFTYNVRYVDPCQEICEAMFFNFEIFLDHVQEGHPEQDWFIVKIGDEVKKISRS